MFNLEQAIQDWKRTLCGNPGYEDGDVVELEMHFRERISELEGKGFETKKAFDQAVEEIGDVEKIGQELYRVISTKRRLPADQSGWTWSILSNYQKVARRNLLKNKLYSGINIAGLSIGITCCLLIYIFVQNELNYDNFHEKGDRIYRVVRIMDYQSDTERKVGITSAPFKGALKNDFPGMIEKATHMMPSDGVVTIDDKKFRESDFFIADPNYFTVFSYPFLYGDPASALQKPNTVVLSSETAKKYFGNENPIGKTIKVDGEYEFEVTGVFKHPENYNTHIEFDLVASMETFREARFMSEWWWNQMHTYVLLVPNVKPQSLEEQLPGFMEKYFGHDMAQNNRKISLALQPLESIYFANDTTFDWKAKHGSKTVIYMFGIIALLITVVACVNFVNLATARSINRAREIGIRKTLGAQRFSLMIQFLGEGLVMTFIAGLLSFGLVYLLFPWFQQVVGKEISLSLFSPEILIVAILFLIVTGLAAGIYPSLFLSSFRPIKALKEKIDFGTSQLIVRKGLIVFQFAISSLLIIGTIIVNKQLDYVSSKSLGFQPEQLLNISINSGDMRPHLETFQQEIERLPGVEASSLMSGTPGGFFDNYLFRVGENWDETHTLNTLFVDHNFTEVLDLEMLAGRDFDPAFSTDSAQAAIINKEAADIFGWSPEEAIGKRIQNQFIDSTARQIIGVVENFHFASLHVPIAPLVVTMAPDQREILVKINTKNVEQTLAFIEESWNTLSPLYPMEYVFLDQQFAQLYESDQRQRKIFSAFSAVAIFIACLGLFSLAAFNAEKRSKEMGIRKVLVITQFAISAALIASTIIVYQQINYIKNTPLGYARDQVLTIPLNPEARDNYEAIRFELARHSGIQSVSSSSHVPTSGTSHNMYSISGIEDELSFAAFYVDNHFLETYGLTLQAGDDVEDGITLQDSVGDFMVSSLAVKEAGLEKPEDIIGRTVRWDDFTGPVTGVVNDMILYDLRQQPYSIIFVITPVQFHKYISVRINTAQTGEVLAYLNSVWDEHVPSYPLEYNFLDEKFEQMHLSDQKMAETVIYFAILAIIIACLGLFGLTAYMAQRKTKEIGVRKVLGANVPQIITLLSRDFLKLVAIALLFGLPMAYWVMNTWLQEFAFKIEIKPTVFLYSCLIVLVISFLTISYQTFKAARLNPAVSLKNV